MLCALLGILIGKYLSFVWALQERGGRRVGEAVDIPVFSMDTVDSCDEPRHRLRLDRPALGRLAVSRRLARPAQPERDRRPHNQPQPPTSPT